MVTTAKRLFFFEGREAATLYVGATAACIVGVGTLMVGAHAATVALALLHVAGLTGIAVAWLRADSAAQAARQASSDVAVLASRLVRLEQRLKAPEASPALRSTMAEVTGTVGLLGGVVRELARNVAAQHKDVASLKDTIGGAQGEGGDNATETVGKGPAAEPAVDHPEPSLLPSRSAALEDLGRVRLVMQAFEADRIELHLQPVVALPQRKVRFYEILARLRLLDGTLLGPTEFLPVLERFGRAPDFDRRMIVRAVAVARHLVARGSEAIVGVNLTPRSIREPGFLHSLARITEAAPDVVGKVVLEFPQEVWRGLDPDQKEALAILPFATRACPSPSTGRSISPSMPGPLRISACASSSSRPR
ncbi:EAL domain-containing protein [Microvirga subterranea]|uniref:Cyclic-di-GMP phosphodiesterase TipF (Flagellum assembly factor) n=1 Tax=Microvirga subterranea TaxID=186651 RepID=A0A370HI52_9HYPH|nr:EAL domain-containing protein [Microvirga subterranea]RDI57871.1 cyclic-di-GMP phosphodiesterase TipF (flagellum assembly factor) [Microvirga subterranea]